MNQINKNRLIGGSVIAFAALLFAPAILTPKEHDLSNPTLAVSIDKNNPVNTQVATTQTIKTDTQMTTAVPIPPPPALKLESAPTTTVASTAPTTAKANAPKATSVALEKPATVTSKPTVKPVTAKTSWLRVGSYTSAKNANSQLKALNKSKYSVKVEQVNINGTTYHRVLVGPYNDEKTLQKAKKALIAGGYEASIQR